MMNENPDELERLRQRVEMLERQLEQQRQAEEAQRRAAPTQRAPDPAPAPGMGRRAMNFMYNAGNMHAAARNFLWALDDGVKIVGFVGGCAVAAMKATPAMLAKAKAAYAAALALAAANPVGVAAGGVVAVIAAERATRYQDENGETRHRCVIM